MKPINIYRKLLACFSGLYDRSISDKYTLQRVIKNGEQIPDKCLPGRGLNVISAEEREILKNLKSEDVEKEINPFTYYKK